MDAPMQGIRIRRYGGPEAMELEEVVLPAPGPAQALVKVEFAGVNFYDTQQRSGFIKRDLPIAPGVEAAGTVEAAGAQAGVTPGMRVAWAQSPGSYATHALVERDRLVALPATVTFEQAAAVLFQGMTAHHLACSTYPLEPGDACFVHSAAGGVGGLLCQMAAMRGATVVGAVSSEAKAAIASEYADHVLVYGRDDVIAETKRLTGGLGAHVVYDAVGKDTFETSLGALRPRGLLAIYGEASGFIPPFDLRRLSAAGCVFITRTSLGSYIATRAEFLERAEAVLTWVGEGKLTPRIHGVYPLASAAEAHRALESRGTIGKVLLRCA
jgi:NADPH:quinone reductase